jgi:hypothetical protein
LTGKCRDVSTAFLQSDSTISRRVYMFPPPEMGLPPESLLRVVRPLYGLPEAPLHWYSTYSRYHRETLGMDVAAHDPCFYACFQESDCVGGYFCKLMMQLYLARPASTLKKNKLLKSSWTKERRQSQRLSSSRTGANRVLQTWIKRF